MPDAENNNWQPLETIHPEGFDPKSGTGEEEFWYADEYVRALDEGREHKCSGNEALHTIEIMMGIFESAAYGIRVDLHSKTQGPSITEMACRKWTGCTSPNAARLWTMAGR